MDVDDPVVDLVRPAGDGLQQLITGQDRARPPGERGQQPDLARGQASLDRIALIGGVRCAPA